ncbi:MAG: hypothetical protein GXY79_11670, partial [Chloroflexi bacterium]|nr:hypothetical protein [Chloroflexota bacterium]
MTRCSRLSRIALVMVVLLALGLRLYRLDAQSLWNDEGTTVALVQRDIPTILQNASDDIHPPLYYIVLHYWVAMLGTSEAAARGLSVLTGTLVVLGTWLLGKRFLPPWGALLAAGLAATSPLQVYYSQEARMYILATLLALWLVAASHRLLEAWEGQNSGQAWQVATVPLAGTALLYTHYFSATVLLAVNVAFLYWAWTKWRAQGSLPWRRLGIWTGLMLLIIAAYLPWVLRAWHTVAHWPAVSAPATLPHMLSQVMIALTLGITTPSGRLSTSIAALASGLAIAGTVALVQHRSEPHRRHWPVAMLVLWLTVPVLAMVLGSLYRPMLNVKFLLPVTPAVHLLLAAGLTAPLRSAATGSRHQFWRPILAAAMALIILAGATRSLQGLYHDPRYARDDYRGIVNYIRDHAGPHAAILINAPSQIETIDYYHNPPPPMYPLARQRPLDVGTTLAELEQIVHDHDELYGIFWATADSDPEGIIEGWLAEHTFKTMDRWYGNLRLVAYAVPPPEAELEMIPVESRFG